MPRFEKNPDAPFGTIANRENVPVNDDMLPDPGDSGSLGVGPPGADGQAAQELAYSENLNNVALDASNAGGSAVRKESGCAVSFVMPNRPVLLEFYAGAFVSNELNKLLATHLIKTTGVIEPPLAVADGGSLGSQSKPTQSAAGLSESMLWVKRLDPIYFVPGRTYGFKVMLTANAGTTGLTLYSGGVHIPSCHLRAQQV